LEAALHRLARHQKSARYFIGRQPTKRPERERRMCVGCQGRMTTREDQLQSLVWDTRVVPVVFHSVMHVEQSRLGSECALAPETVDRPVARGRYQPGAGFGRSAIAWPPLCRNRECLLKSVLGKIEIAEEADQ
jgi:hypothetical protein